MRNKLYCFSGQAAAVRALLDGASLAPGFHGLVAVNEPNHLRGLEGITFAIVKNHPRPLPQTFMEMIVAYGMTTIVLSDEFRRVKAREWMRTAIRPCKPGDDPTAPRPD